MAGHVSLWRGPDEAFRLGIAETPVGLDTEKAAYDPDKATPLCHEEHETLHQRRLISGWHEPFRYAHAVALP